MTRAQLDGLALASMAALETFVYRGGKTIQLNDHGIRWIRSYWEEGGTWGLCLFDAPDLDILRAYQDLCGLPSTKQQEVSDLEPIAREGAEANLALEVSVGTSFDPDPGAFLESDGISLPERARLVRLVWDRSLGDATVLVNAEGPGALEQLRANKAFSRVARVVEIVPDDYR